MKKIKYILCMLLFLVFTQNVSAASISVATSSSVVVVGNSVTAYFTLSSDVDAWDFTVGYDTSKLRLVSSNLESTAHSVSTIQMHSNSRSYSITFKAIASGSATIYISSADCASVTCSKGSKTITLKTQAEIEASYSKNNNLSSLGIEGTELSPAFNKDNLEYSVELQPETTSVNVNASVEDSTASISGAGAREVTDGDNKLEIIVTAENGATKTYVINAKVKEYNPITVKIADKEYTVVRKKSSLTAPNNYTETTVKISDEDVPAFKSEITGYTLVALKDADGNQSFYIYDEDSYTRYLELGFAKIILSPMELNKKDIPKGYSQVKINYNDQEITAYKLTENSDYALIYGMNVETGEKHIYMYNSIEDTVQIYNTEEIKFLKQGLDLYLKIIIGLISVSVILFLTIIIIIFKKAKRNKNEKQDNNEVSVEKEITDYTEMRRKELSKKEIKQKEKENRKKEKQELKEAKRKNKNKKSLFVDEDDVKVEKIDMNNRSF